MLGLYKQLLAVYHVVIETVVISACSVGEYVARNFFLDIVPFDFVFAI